LRCSSISLRSTFPTERFLNFHIITIFSISERGRFLAPRRRRYLFPSNDLKSIQGGKFPLSNVAEQKFSDADNSNSF